MTRRLSIPTLACVLLAAPAALAAERPSVLFCSPSGAAWGWVDLTYLGELHDKGFEVDYTEKLEDVTPERIEPYNVLVIYMTPDAYEVTNRAKASDPERVRRFAEMIDGYVARGGGVLLFPTEHNIRKQQVADLTRLWGAKLPVERIREEDPAKLGRLRHVNQQLPLAWTHQVPPSPVSEGVRQVWYPIQPAYNAGQSGPIDVDDAWQVVLRGSKTSRTEPVDLAASTSPELEDPFIRPGGVAEPAIMAIRPYKAGRIALLNQWRQYSVGSGTRYIFDRQVLSTGVGDRASDFGRLLENTLRWLAEPSLSPGTPGGYVTPPERLLAPNRSEEVRKDYADRFWPYDRDSLSGAGPPPGKQIFRGLLGAKSEYSSGSGSVEQYAAAAKAAGLDFLIFMEDFDRLTPEKLDALAADCKRLSNETLLLLPGFEITNNVGNRMFFYSPEPAWIPDYCRTGPDKKILYIQEEDGQGGYTGYITPFLDWVLGHYHVDKGQVGYFDFSASPHGMRMPELRLYAMVGLRYYRDGRLVEDNTADYLTTAQGTIPPAPASVNEVRSPQELAREVAAGHALLYAQARSLETVFMEALRWTHQYDGPNVFTSDGPLVDAWPQCFRVATLGGEAFVTGRAVMPCPLAVRSEVGLKEIRVYNGEQLFRRFLPGGAKEFRQTLVLDGTIQKNLVLVAEDVQGHSAVTFARRCWKDGALAAVFCSDHVNDGTMALAHGPCFYPAIRHPHLPTDIAGATWDGGPLAALPLTGHQTMVPTLESDQGTEEGGRFDQVPLLEFSDEGALAVRSPRRELFDPRVQRVVNPWHTYGPIGGSSKLMEYTHYYREYVPATIGVPETGWAGPGVRVGTNASVFRNEITFKRDMTIKSLKLGYFSGEKEAVLAVGTGEEVRTFPLSEAGYAGPFEVGRGDWFGYFRDGPANSNLFVNRGEPFELEIRAPYVFFSAALDDAKVQAGQSFRFELAGVGIPVNVEVNDVEGLQGYLDYIEHPAGMELLRGSRAESPGLVDLVPEDYAVELAVPKPAEPLDLTLPCLVAGLNPRWSAGLWQKQGYVKGDYGPGENRYRALGTDLDGNAYVPLYVDRAERTHVVAGHPVVAGPEGSELFIQVTKVGQAPDRWHVSINNPMDRAVQTTLRAAMDLPGLELPETAITVPAGGYVVIQ